MKIFYQQNLSWNHYPSPASSAVYHAELDTASSSEWGTIKTISRHFVTLQEVLQNRTETVLVPGFPVKVFNAHTQKSSVFTEAQSAFSAKLVEHGLFRPGKVSVICGRSTGDGPFLRGLAAMLSVADTCMCRSHFQFGLRLSVPNWFERLNFSHELA